MKIIKKNVILESVLKEEDIKDETVVGEAPVADPTAVGEVAATAIEAETGGAETLDTDKVDDVATEVKEIASDIRAGEVYALAKNLPIKVVNKLTKALDECLRKAKQQQDDDLGNGYQAPNLLVVGLPGSAKTAVVDNWCSVNNIELQYIDSSDEDLGPALSGFMIRDETKTNATTRAKSTFLDRLDTTDRPAVIFLDEYNRAPEGLRAKLLQLVNNRRVFGVDEKTGASKLHVFEKLLFTVTAMNPAGFESDVGAGRTSQAEKTRYYMRKKVNSDAQMALDYYKSYYTDCVVRACNKQKVNINRVNEFISTLGIAICLLTDRRFPFTTDENASKFEDDPTSEATHVNQRMLTFGLSYSDGSVSRFLEWLDEDSWFLEDDRMIIKDILNAFRTRTDDFLRIAKETIIRQVDIPGLGYPAGLIKRTKKILGGEEVGTEPEAEDPAAPEETGTGKGDGLPDDYGTTKRIEKDDGKVFATAPRKRTALSAADALAKITAADSFWD